MIQSYINSITLLPTNSSSVSFQTDCIKTRSCRCNGQGWLCHNEGSANYNITRGGLYDVDFSASVSSATAGTIAFALFDGNGEMIPGTLMAETIAAANDYANISVSKTLPVCCNGTNISVKSIPTVPTPTAPTTPITTQVPIIISANLKLKPYNG